MRREAGYKRAVLGTTILSNGKGHFGPKRPDQKDQKDRIGQRWSQIFRLDRTEMVLSI